MRDRLLVTAALLVGMASPGMAGSVSGKVTAKGLRSNADAVIYLEVAGKTFEAPKEPVLMDQTGKEFLPKVVVVPVGTTVEFLNSDPFAHNVFTPDKCADKFNLGSWPQGEKKSHLFDKACAAVMLCNVHPEMTGYVVAVPSSHYAVTDAEGSYSIADVPDGTYTLWTWHERFKKQSQEIVVKGGATSVDITLAR